MCLSSCKRVRGRLVAVRHGPLWELPRWLVSFILVVVTGYVAVIGVAARSSPLTLHDGLLLGALLACIAATVELTKREGENAGLAVDVYGVWELPIAILLTPFYALTVPVFRCALTQWRGRRLVAYRRVFTTAILGLSYGGASMAFHAVTGTPLGVSGLAAAHPTVWILAAVSAAVTQWAVNTIMLVPALKGSDPAARIRDLMFDRQTVTTDVTELCVAVLVTLGTAISLLAIAFALPFVTLLQRSVRHASLVNASRLDSKTGLLNAGTWEREATAEVARAIRTRSPMAVALLDIDHFKSVNDTYGHLVGDKALQAIARTLQAFVREYDLVGRFGGEEFVMLLPQARPVDAYTIAERIRAHIADMPIEAGPDIAPIQVTISIGVAALGSSWDTTVGGQLTDLIAAADMALYQAKRNGRDQVCVITENATFGSRLQSVSVPPAA